MANTVSSQYKSEILLVEDSDVDAKLTMMALNDAQITNPVINLRDGDEALNYFSSVYDNRKNWTKYIPVIILLDLKMPKVNGKEVLKKLKSEERTKDIPVIIFTSSNEDRDIEECFDIGANSYVVKPVEFSKFEEVVREIGSYWLKINYNK